MKMQVKWVTVTAVLALVAAEPGKGRKHRHNKPGRAVLDRLASTIISAEITGDIHSQPALLPAPLDVSPFTAISANATCGELGAEDFCRDMPGKRGIQCGVCEGPDGAASRRHPPSHAVDGDRSTWWQSPTLAAGDQYQDVALVFTLPADMELLHVIIKSGPSSRPLAWSLETSASRHGEDWRMLRAFGDKDNCRRLWSLQPERRRRRVRRAKPKRTHRADKIACSTQFASPKPLENGEMHVGLGEGVVARRVHIALRALHAGQPDRRFYTVRAVTIAARCICYGHATSCAVTSENAICECTHNTCGDHCDRCCSGGAWEPGADCPTMPANDVCHCGERGACSYDETGAVVCVNCTGNRGGPLCEHCLQGYYSIEPDSPCLPCNCNPQGSDESCEWSPTSQSITCICHEGFAGDRCDECLDPTTEFPNCGTSVLTSDMTSVCKCDPRGIVEGADICDALCRCKAKVLGDRCDTCAPGHYGLSADLREGCRKCYCSGVTDICSAHPEPSASMVFPAGAWRVTSLEGAVSGEVTYDEIGRPYLVGYEDAASDVYWTAEWIGAGAFGSRLQAASRVAIARGDAGGEPTRGADVVITTHGGARIAYGGGPHETPGDIILDIPLVEDGWYEVKSGEPGRERVTRTKMMQVLNDAKELMLRASFHMDQEEARLLSAEVLGSFGREQCACPLEYAGASCERCGPGHVWDAGLCRQCPCGGHTDCDPVTFACNPCQHNTTGANCENCADGHFGPIDGVCVPCACPLLDNSVSPSCRTIEDGYVCTQCPQGYVGDHCETCDEGYWGLPLSPGGRCTACACGGGACDPLTGSCVLCPPHASGPRCDQCEEGFWFSLETGECVPCECGSGAVRTRCGADGACECRVGWDGPRCDNCANGHGDVSAGCPACRCGMASAGCERVSGRCACSTGAAPPHCDACLPDYYDLTVGGCSGCNCSSIGSIGGSCDIRTGQCRCREHVTGRACDVCEEGYWGLSSGGCRRCSCGAGACDPETGACACGAGATGLRCERCLPGYFGYGPHACKPCPACGPREVCHPGSGRCVCPARAAGPGCTACVRGAWGSPACQPCVCGRGALDGDCDQLSGQCRCGPGWTGRACDLCAPGHFGPRCRPCGCHPPGTRSCGDRPCECDYEGRCQCKENVQGAKCTECRAGTFGLSVDNPHGCTACFCFGRSASCSQAGLTRVPLSVPDATIVVTTPDHPPHELQSEWEGGTAIRLHSQQAVMTVGSGRPLYLDVGPRWAGDRVTSYGGVLTYSAVTQGGDDIRPPGALPLVRIYGGHNLILDYYERMPPVNDTYLVRLHESLWRARVDVPSAAEGPASRTALMAALSNVRRVLLRVSTRVPHAGSDVYVTVWNVSLEVGVASAGRSRPALGVEACACGSRHGAWSCQQASPGWWQPPGEARYVAGTIVITVPDTRPCFCNGRAAECASDTGDCLNCTGGTAGPQCERCADGYERTGEASEAGGACEPCECPRRTENRAASCKRHHHQLYCQCLPGYTGARCERCEEGYSRRNGRCEPCVCDPRGPLTGAATATCRADVGQGHCLSCDNCTTTLLAGVSSLSLALRRSRMSEPPRAPPPSRTLDALLHNASALHAAVRTTAAALSGTVGLNENVMEDLENGMKSILEEAESVNSLCRTQHQRARDLVLEALSAEDAARAQWAALEEQARTLRGYAAAGGRHAGSTLREGAQLLRGVKDVRLADYVAGVQDVFDSATIQLTWIQEQTYLVDESAGRARAPLPRLERLHARAEDVTRLADAVWDRADVVAAAAQRTRAWLARQRGREAHIMLEEISSMLSNNRTQETQTALSSLQATRRPLPELARELRVVSDAAQHKEGVLFGLAPLYRRQYLAAAEEHVQKLGKQAREYTRALKAQASAAGEAGGLARELALARAAAVSAKAAASAAERVVRDGLAARARALANNSMGIKSRAEGTVETARELGVGVERGRRVLERVRVQLRGLGWAERALMAEGGARTVGVEAVAAVRGAGAVADRVFVGARALHEEAAGLRRRAAYGLRRVLADLVRQGDTAIGAAQELVSQIRGHGTRAREVAGALAGAAAARQAEHRIAHDTLQPALDTLRATVGRARHAADSISVSLTSLSPPGCSRAYRVRTSATVTRVTIALSLETTAAEGPLLSLGTGPGALRLLLEDGRATLRWEGGELRHPAPVRPAGEHDHGAAAYRIDIERVWNRVSLSLDDGVTALTVSNTTGVSWTSPPAAELWLGDEGGARGTGLPACVHALEVDEKRVGLWNFMSQPPHAKCTGCGQRYYVGGDSGGMVWFSGVGSYAEVSRSGLRPYDLRAFSLALSFRTTDRDALLFAAEDSQNNRSISLFLRACRVVFRVEYTGARLELVGGNGNGPCAGRPVHVQAVRLFHDNKLEKGSLRVDGSETLGSPEPPVRDRSALPALHAASYWLGGVPPGARRSGGAERPLRGCMGALLVDRRGYDPLDTARRHGVEPGCRDKGTRGVTLEGAGWVELPAPQLRRGGALGLTWASRGPDAGGVLLLRAPAPNDGDPAYLALVLVDGAVELSAFAGKGPPLRTRTNHSHYADGRAHSARVLRNHKIMELWIDDELVASGSLPGAALLARSGGLYLGGAGPDVGGGTPDHLREATAFTGTLTDFIVDARLIGLETALRWSEAALGYAEPPLADQPPAHTTSAPVACPPPPTHAVEAGAVSLGGAPGSHAAFKLGAKDVKQLDVALDFRTFRPDGVLLFMPGTKAKPKHHLLLMIKDSKLRLIVRGRRRKEIALEGEVSDGRWRSVRVRLGGGRAVLQADGQEAAARGRAALQARLFVGGAGSAAGAGSKWRGLLGCVRRLMVGGRARGLAGAARGAGQCAPHVEGAAHFAGDAHAGTQHEVDGPVELQIKTSAENGIVAAYGDILLELRAGVARLSRKDGASVTAGAALCDGRWHGLRAAWDDGLELAVDGAAAVRAMAAPVERAPLLVGGVPESAAGWWGGRHNLRGCVRDVGAGGRALPLETMTLHNVLLDACPVAA